VVTITKFIYGVTSLPGHMVQTLKQIPTGIEGLDGALNGGVPQGNVVLFTGSCGTGKTTVAMEYLIKGAKMGENGVFISVTEPTFKLLENMRRYEFFDEVLIDDNKIFLIDLLHIYRKMGLLDRERQITDIDALVLAFEDIVKALDIKRAVVDSITAVCNRLKEQSRIRDFIFNLVNIFTYNGATSIFISEISAGTSDYSVYGVEEAVADGIIVFDDLERRGDMMRTMQIIKMRGTQHSRAKYVMDLQSDGMVLAPLLKGGSD